MYWICRPCKNNRHDLCLQNSSSRAGTNIKIHCWCSLQPAHELRLRAGSREIANPSIGAELGRRISAKGKRNE